MKIVIIGYGSIGRRHASILKENFKNCKIFLHTKQKVKKFRSFKDFKYIKFIKPDYVIIASETYKHLKQLTYLEENFKGIKILIEKPLFHQFNKFKVKNNKVYVGYNLRFHPLLQILKENIKNRKIWSVQIICGSYLPSWRKNIDYRKSYSSKKNGGGVNDNNTFRMSQHKES